MDNNLAALKGFREENDIIITPVPYNIGRSRSANFIIPHVNVSREHCQIVKENGSWKVNDWSSSGTFVNNSLVGKGKSVVISNGDSIRLGPVESDLSWIFMLLPDGISVENCGPKAQLLLNLQSEKECPSVKCIGWKMQYPGNNFGEVKANRQDVESENKVFINLTDGGEKIQELWKDLQQMQGALNNIAEQNSALQEKLASEVKNKTADLKAKTLENLTDLMETEMQCTICSELFVTAVILCCSHTFCKYCIDQWKKKQKTCPICRKKITKETRSLVVDNYIDKMVVNLSVELKERREAIIKERKEVPTKKQMYPLT